MDPLSDVLRSVRLAGGIFLDARFTAPWAVLARMTSDDCGAFLAAPAQLIAFHVVTAGRLQLTIPGTPPVDVRAGEIVLLPRNDEHTLASGPGLAAVPASTLIRPGPAGGVAQLRHGGGGEPAQIVCGFLATDGGFNPLLATLPRCLTLDIREAAARAWIEASVRFAAGELAAGRVGSAEVISRLSEVLLVEAVRHYAGTADGQAVGWLRGVNDDRIGRALALIHRDLATPWSAEALAREVAMSRSAFVERFSALVGTPPIRYLTVCRLQAARLQLRETRKSIAQLARAVGYESEQAFSRAFKREFGRSPAHWREREQEGAADARH